jgi:hypothetical protein
MGESPRAEGGSNYETWQTNDVSLGSPQNRSGSASTVGQSQAREESLIRETGSLSATAIPASLIEAISTTQIRVSVFQLRVLIAVT